MKLKSIKQKIYEITDEELYSPQRIVKLGLITDTNLTPSVFTFYRLIKRGKLKAVNLGGGGSPRYFVKGQDLKKFLKERYKIIN